MPSKPLVYVLHGAWHNPEYFQTVKVKFEAPGYNLLCPQQPSTGASPPTKTLHDGATYVRAELELLIEHGQEVVLVMHSYGGVVETQAATGLGKAERMKKGKSGGIVRLFYACAFLLPLGSDLCRLLGGSLPPWITEEVSRSSCSCRCWKVVLTLDGLQQDGSCNPIEPEHVFYQDLQPTEQKFWAAKLKHHSVIAQKTALTQVAYGNIPVAYLYCKIDQALPLAVQEMMVLRSGLDVLELWCEAGHSPFLSQPDVFVESVLKSIPD